MVINFCGIFWSNTRLFFWLKALLHRLHSYGLSPVWDWLYLSNFWEKKLNQWFLLFDHNKILLYILDKGGWINIYQYLFVLFHSLCVCFFVCLCVYVSPIGKEKIKGWKFKKLTEMICISKIRSRNIGKFGNIYIFF